MSTGGPRPPDGVETPGERAWSDALLAAALFAVDPVGTGGVRVRAAAGPARDRWMEWLRACLPEAVPLRRLPLHVSDGRLLGGLDLVATLRTARPVAERGLLADADGGVLALAMAERLPAGTAARIAAAMDAREVATEREGLQLRSPCRIGVVALDEALDADEALPGVLAERLAFDLRLDAVSPRAARLPAPAASAVAAARERLRRVHAGDEVIEALCAAAAALGIDSSRSALLALRVACAGAALAGRAAVAQEDAEAAARLVLAPRARALPQPPQADAQPADVPEDEAGGEPPPPPPGDDAASEPPASAEGPLEDRVLEAARAAIPAGLLAQLQAAVAAGLSRRPPPGKAGEARANRTRGRIAGTRRHVPGDGGRVAVVDTLRNAAPWQPLRRREADLAGRSLPSGRRVEVRSDDLRAHRYRQHLQTVTLFAVDASGSSALHRLAEAKGAVELLLADCYVRRDEVALVAFRGHAAELLLPPTRSLVRVKRSLAGLPGGGGTPLAAGIETAATLARAVLARGQQPSLVFLTDGRANVARDGTPGRERGEADALAAVRGLRALGVACLVIDTSPRPGPASRHLAEAMGARYLALPHADAATVARAVQAAAPDARVAA